MDILEKARQHFPLETTGQPFQTHELQRIKVVREMADEIERLREALRLMPKTITDAADEIERLRKALTDLDRGINQWITTYSAIKKTLLKIISDALKEGK